MREYHAVIQNCVVVGLFLLMGACQDTRVSKTVEIDGTIRNLVVDIAVGDVVIWGTSRTGATVTSTLECRVVPPGVVIQREEETVHVHMSEGIGGAYDCQGLIEIELSRETSIAVRTGSGHLQVSDISGDVQLHTYDGDVGLAHLAGSLDVQVASGNVLGTDMVGSVGRVYTGLGNVDLDYGTTPAFVDVDIIHGDAALRVPENIYSINADTLEGNVDIQGLTSAPDSGRLLWLMVDTGNIWIAGHRSPPSPMMPVGTAHLRPR